MDVPDAGLIAVYLLARLTALSVLLLIVAAVVCPSVWSRDAARRARAREALRLLGCLITGRRIR